MAKMENGSTISRRAILQTGGALVVSVGTPIGLDTVLGVDADRLTVTDGVVGDGAKKVSYAELIGGRYFNVQLDWNKQFGNPLYAPGKAKPKASKDYKIVGQPIPREDIVPKVYAQEDFV